MFVANHQVRLEGSSLIGQNKPTRLNGAEDRLFDINNESSELPGKTGEISRLQKLTVVDACLNDKSLLIG